MTIFDMCHEKLFAKHSTKISFELLKAHGDGISLFLPLLLDLSGCILAWLWYVQHHHNCASFHASLGSKLALAQNRRVWIVPNLIFFVC